MSEPITLAISALGHRGEGVASHQGKPVYVPLTLAGETVSAIVEGNRGHLQSVLDPAPDRAIPFCPHFGVCGGCQLQHMTPEAYANFKRGLVVGALEREGIVADVASLVLAHGEGRRRVTLHATPRAAGFMGRRSHDIAAIEHCPILVPALKAAPAIARAIAGAVGPCDIALTATDTGLDVDVRAKSPRKSARLPEIASGLDLARLSINGETVLQYRVPLVAMGQAQVPVPPASFLQATAAAEQVLSEMAVEAAQGHGEIADLFCGVGPFALRLAKHGPVFAADSDRAAIAALDAARRAAKGLKAISAERRDLFRDPLSPFEINRFGVVVIDPPRAGAAAQIAEIARSKLRRLVYVSCDPQSFARDASALVQAGFAPGIITPVDQFAWSAHVELFCVFTR